MLDQKTRELVDHLQHIQQIGGRQKLRFIFGAAFKETINAPKQRFQCIGVHDIGELHDMRQMPRAPPQKRLLACRRQMQGLMKDCGNRQVSFGVTLEPSHQVFIQTQA